MLPTDAKRAMACLTHGVYVLGVHTPEKDNLMTAAWLCQVSGKPPMLLAAVGSGHLTAELIPKAGGFAVSVLTAEQKDIAEKNGFTSGRKTDKLAAASVTFGHSGHPLVNGALAWLECRLVDTVVSTNHTLFIAEVTSTRVFSGEPMTYREKDFF